MNTEFISFFKNLNLVNLDDIKALFKIARIKKYTREEHIVTEGQTFTYAILVLKGVLRNYMLDSKGNNLLLRVIKLEYLNVFFMGFHLLNIFRHWKTVL